MSEPTGRFEAVLEQARRHVAEAEARVTRQAELLARTEADDDSAMIVDTARKTLETMQ